ncbi:hypothetical protein ACFL59_02740, partial [Planctomycetota bacterium]
MSTRSPLLCVALALACASCGTTEKRETEPRRAPNAPVAPAKRVKKGPLLAQAGAPARGGPVVAQAGKGGRPRPPAGKPARGSVKQQEERYLADSYAATGAELYRQMRYHEAAVQLRIAVRLDPNNAEAQSLLDRTLYILGDREAGFRDEMRRLVDETQVHIRLATMEVERLFKEGQGFMNRSEFDRAIERFEKVIETIRYFPYNVDKSGIRAQADSALSVAKAKEQDRQLHLKRERQRAAAEEAAIFEQRNLAYHHARVRNLMEQAKAAFRRMEFGKAEDLTASVLALEPTSREAAKLKERAAHARRIMAELERIETSIEETQRLIEGVYEAAIPFQSVFKFPSEDDWRIVEKRSFDLKRLFLKKGKTESPEEQRIIRTLDSSKITINFPGTPFADAIDFLRDVTGINYVVAKSALEHLESEEPEINLKLKDITLKNALELILTEAGGLIFRVRNDAVVINTADAEQEEMFLRFYEVSEIIGEPPDFEAPQLALAEPTEDGGGGGGVVLSIDDDEAETGTGVTADKLIELIEQKLGDDDVGTAEFLGGLLMVRKPMEAHRKIERLLDQLRRTTGIMVTVETRLIDIQDNMLEEIGVDFRGLSAVIPNFLGNNLDQNIGFNWTHLGQTLDLRTALVNWFTRGLGSAAGTPFNLSSIGGMAMQYNMLDDFQLQAIVDAVKRQQEAREVDSPRVMVFNGQRSHVMTVSQEAYIADLEVNQTGVTPTVAPVIGILNSGSILEVRPIVSYDRKFVTLEIQPTLAVNGVPVLQRVQLFQGQLGPNTDITIELPVVSLTKIRTTVMVPDGGTVILGGLKNFLEQKKYVGLPGIRHIPLLNNLFERKGFSDLKRSLIV